MVVSSVYLATLVTNFFQTIDVFTENVSARMVVDHKVPIVTLMAHSFARAVISDITYQIQNVSKMFAPVAVERVQLELDVQEMVKSIVLVVTVVSLYKEPHALKTIHQKM